MRVVIDTNVLVSGILFGEPPRQVLRLAAQGRISSVTSPALLREAEDVLLRPKFGLRPEQAVRIVALFRETSSIVTPSPRVSAIRCDPADNRVLEAAEAASADLIVSGDSHLLDLACWQGIRIVSPAACVQDLERLRKGSG